MSDRRKLTQAERKTVLDRFCGRCAYCGKQITMQELNVDHLVPIRKGGEDMLYNMYPSCLNWKCPEGAMSCGKSEEARNKWSS